MASEVDGWSDAQIREKFEEMGSPAPPVTATTRKIMVKRLKILLQNGGNPIAKPHEEEIVEDDDEPDALPPPPTRIPRRLGRSAIAALNESQNSRSARPSLSPIDRSPSRVPISPVRNGRTNNSDETRSKSPGRKSFGRRPQEPDSGNKRASVSPSRKSPSRISKIPIEPSNDINNFRENRTRSPGRKSLGRAPDFHTPELDEENQPPIRKLTPGRRNPDAEETLFSRQSGSSFSPSRISSGAFSKPSNTFEPRKSAEQILQDAFVANEGFRSRLLDSSSADGFESDFMRKISTPPRRPVYKGNDDMLSDDEDAINSPVKVTRGNKTSGYEVRSGNTGRGTFPIVLFFVVLVPLTILIGSFVLFYNIADSEVSVPKIVFPACRGSSVDVPGVNCIEEVDRAPVETLFEAFKNGLIDLRLGAPCTTSLSQPVFIDNNSIKDIIVNNNNEISVWVAEKKLKEMKVFIDANPFLNLKSKTDGLLLIKGPDTFLCFLWSKIVLLAEWIIKICVTSMLAGVAYVGVQWYLTNQQKRKEDISTAVDKIIDLTKTRKYITMEQAEKELTSSGFSADVISDALKSATTDSRVNLDSRNNAQGIRWIGETTSTDSGDLWSNDRGDNEQIGSYILPLTSCLKIRGMFNPTKKIMSDADIRQMVDAILEKSIGNRIVHLVVDRKSPDGIVYLRGLTKADAGGVFRRINGSLFDGRRISVKYVRETRYDEQFPDSASYTRPLRPSHNN